MKQSNKKQSLLDKDVKRISIYDVKNEKELAVITNKIETANSNIIVKVKFY